MVTIIGIAGSLRRRSLNAALLRAAVEAAPAGCSVEIASIDGIPLYNGDVEAAEGIPAVASAIKERIAAAHGLLLVTPEYNNSLPGVLKNAVDWLSRPSSDIPRVFGGRAVGVIGASPGRMGTVLSQTAWLPVMRALGTRPWCGKTLYVTGADKLIDDSGRLADEATRERLRSYLEGFAAFAGS